MVLEAFAQALLNFTDIGLWFFVIVGVIVGLALGLIPGIGGLVGLALFLPFVFALSPTEALPFMVALTSASFTGGAIMAILLNIPGQETSSATLIDGFPMTKKGQGGRALGAALASSAAGGVFTVFIALAMVPLILPMVMSVVSADMVFIILLGIAFIAVLSKGSMVKGLISGGLGIIISTVGFQAKTGVPRFTFGTLYLYDGIGLIPLVLGIFALPEAINLIAKGGTIAQAGLIPERTRDIVEGMKDVFRHWWLWLRSSLTGYVIGIIPGIGGITATFIAYGQAKQTSKHPERFGTGIVEGVIAPESANNASQAGSLLTALALGIPGSASTAILLGGFLMLGLIPGPEMMREHLDLSLTLLLIVIAGNIIAIAICLPLIRYMVKVAFIPGRILVPIIMGIALVGAFAFREQFADVIVAVIFTGLGIAMVRFGYNRPALFLGFILGRLFEKYLFISLAVSGPLFFLRPISLVLIVVIIVVLFLIPLRRFFGRWFGQELRRS